MTVVITLNTDGPREPGYVLEVAEGLAESVRVLNHLTRDHAALEYPSEADRLIRELSSAAARLPQLLEQVARWLADEDAAGRIEVPSGEWAGLPGTAVTALQVRLDAARAAAMALSADLDHAAHVTAALALREDDDDD